MKKNNKVHIYYLLLGIGIGLVLGSIINFVNPRVKYIEYSEEEIKEKAKGLGMYELDKIFEMNDKFNEKIEENLKNQSLNQENSDKINKNDETKIQEEGKTESEVENNIEKPDKVEYIEFKVKKGDSSETIIDNLLEANIIADKDKFVQAVIRRNVGRKFHYGTFQIPKETDYDTLIDILTK